MSRNLRGFVVIDLVVAVSVAVVVMATAVPLITANSRHQEAKLAARVVAMRLQGLRLEALRRNAHVALRFDADDPDVMRAFVDGDGDGVLSRDIDSGIDVPLVAPIRLSALASGARFGVAADTPAPDDGRALVEGSDPIRMGAARMVSFSPIGTSTSGTIYLSTAGGLQLCVRVMGATGRLRTMWFDRAARAWRTL